MIRRPFSAAQGVPGHADHVPLRRADALEIYSRAEIRDALATIALVVKPCTRRSSARTPRAAGTYERRRLARHHQRLRGPSDPVPQESAPTTVAVALMTIHKPKALAFEHLWIAGMQDGLLPNRRSVP
jgi:hypothetical protein